MWVFDRAEKNLPSYGLEALITSWDEENFRTTEDAGDDSPVLEGRDNNRPTYLHSVISGKSWINTLTPICSVDGGQRNNLVWRRAGEVLNNV